MYYCTFENRVQYKFLLRVSKFHLFESAALSDVFNMRQSYSYRLDICPSVTHWYCVKTAQPIVKLSSLPGSPMILVF